MERSTSAASTRLRLRRQRALVGRFPAVGSATIPGYDGPLPDPPAEPSVSLQGVGPGSTVDALAAAGFPIGDMYIDGGVRMATVSVNDGIVLGIYYENPGFC